MNTVTRLICFGLAAGLVVMSPSLRAEDDEKAVFSGPQKGEKLLPFKVMGVYDDGAGKDVDFVTAAGGGPLLLVFVHKLTRPSWGLTRLLTGYGLERKKDGLSTGIVWLHQADDRSKAEAYLTRARGSLRAAVPVGVSLDGAEGPGAYGLNRKMTLTILVANENKVTANFALVQPSDREAPKILEEVVKLIGGKVPTSEELRKYGGYGRNAMRMDRRLVRILRRLQSKDLTPEQLKEVTAEVDKYVGENKARQRSLGSITTTWARAPDFAKRGTAAAREQLMAWAKKYTRMRADRGRQRDQEDPRWRELLGAVIQKDATPEDVDKAVAAVEKYIADSAERKRDLGRRTSRVVGSKIFADGGYGIPKAREQLKKWAKAYGPK